MLLCYVIVRLIKVSFKLSENYEKDELIQLINQIDYTVYCFLEAADFLAPGAAEVAARAAAAALADFLEAGAAAGAASAAAGAAAALADFLEGLAAAATGAAASAATAAGAAVF